MYKNLSKIFNDNTSIELFASFSPDQWQELYKLSVEQGLIAIIWDRVQTYINEEKPDSEHQPPRSLKIKWALAAENIFRQYIKRKELSDEFAQMMAREGIKCYCMKGLALSMCYPKPSLRESGDFDCWMGDSFDKANKIAIANGAKFDPHDYRHSLILYKGLTIENHQYFLPIRGNARNKSLERYLQSVAPSDKLIEGTSIYYTSAQFHALFIILHMLQHFLYESITLRHMLDWANFVNAEKENVNWAEFNEKCAEAGARRFVEALNCICVRHLGMNIENTQLVVDDRYADKILNDTVQQASQHISGITGLWAQRIGKVKNIIAQRWKFNQIYDRNFLRSMFQSAYGIMFDRNVRL